MKKFITEEILVIESEFDDRDLRGRIVLEGARNDGSLHIVYPIQFPSYILDIDSDVQWEISIQTNEVISSFAISPDQKVLGYLIKNKPDLDSRLETMSFTGVVLSSETKSDQKWWNLSGWYDNDHISIIK